MKMETIAGFLIGAIYAFALVVLVTQTMPDAPKILFIFLLTVLAVVMLIVTENELS